MNYLLLKCCGGFFSIRLTSLIRKGKMQFYYWNYPNRQWEQRWRQTHCITESLCKGWACLYLEILERVAQVYTQF